MPRYMFAAKYSPDGLVGLLAEGGTARSKAVEELTASVGGSVESMHYAFGDPDLYVIADLPDDEAAAAAALTVGASGSASVATIKLLTPEQIDQAIERGSATYRAPGG